MPRMSVAKSLDRMPEAFVSDKHIARAVSREVKAGKLRKLASRLYTRNMVDLPEAIVARNLWSIVVGYFPGVLIGAPVRRRSAQQVIDFVHLQGVNLRSRTTV